MKKLFAIIVLVLLVSLSVFAANGISVRAGGALDYMMGKTSVHAKNSDEMSEIDFSSMGPGFNVGFDFDLSKNILFYLDFAMGFPPEMTIANAISRSDVDSGLNAAKALDPSYKYHDSKTFFSQIAFRFGFGHRFNLDTGAFELSAGAGCGVSRVDEGFKLVKVDGSAKPYYYADFRSVTILSLGLYANARYNFTDRFSAVITAMPDLGFFTIARHVQYNSKASDAYSELGASELKESSGFALSFAVQAAVGLSYTF